MTDWIATDLDSTIFARAWLEEDAIASTWSPTEDSERAPSSWMKAGTHRLLTALGKSFALVPVTARDMESFRRVEVAELNLQGGPAVVANGAYILGWDGKPDPVWEDYIVTRLGEWEARLHEFATWLIGKSAGNARPRLITGPRGLPAYLVAKAAEGWWHSPEGQQIISGMDWQGCRVEVLGLELQVLPPGVGKRDATQEVMKRWFGGRPPLLCLGDMPLDLEFMRLGGLMGTPVGSTLDRHWPA